MPKTNNLERRSYTFEIRNSEEAGEYILSGRPVVYSAKTDINGLFAEVIDPGALDLTDLRDVRFLVNHNTDMIPLARSRRNNGNSTMKLTPDAEGLSLEFIKLDVERNATAAELYSAVSRGDLSGMSFMFRVSDEEWENLDSDYPTRHIKAISSIVEVSAVTFPAYDATEIYARGKDALESARSALDSARQQRATPLDSGLEALKAKTQLLINL